MFLEFFTVKNEKISVNMERVLFFVETKKGTNVILDDGTVIETLENYSAVCSRA